MNVDDADSRNFDALGLEQRTFEFSDVDIDGDGLKFTGYAAIFDQEADLGDFTESINRGAFRKVLGIETNVPMFYDHDGRWGPMATTGSGTLRLREDGTGLRVEADLDEDHIMLPTLRSQVRRGDIKGMSFGFVAGEGNSRIEHRGNKVHRTLMGFAALRDVSPTWTPAYAGTSAELRSELAALHAVSIGLPQQVVSGAYQQLDGRAEDATNAGMGEDEGEQRSGVTAAMVAAAARRRRLQMMGLTLPKGP